MGEIRGVHPEVWGMGVYLVRINLVPSLLIGWYHLDGPVPSGLARQTSSLRMIQMRTVPPRPLAGAVVRRILQGSHNAARTLWSRGPWRSLNN
jgi:hypothetical protein